MKRGGAWLTTSPLAAAEAAAPAALAGGASWSSLSDLVQVYPQQTRTEKLKVLIP